MSKKKYVIGLAGDGFFTPATEHFLSESSALPGLVCANVDGTGSQKIKAPAFL